MLQRIQTIFLLISITLLSIMFFRPLGELMISDGNVIYMNPMKIFDQNDQVYMNLYPLIILLVINVLLGFVVIFLFKNRTSRF